MLKGVFSYVSLGSAFVYTQKVVFTSSNAMPNAIRVILLII